MYQLEPFMAELERRNPGQPEFIQAVRTVLGNVIGMVNEHPEYEKNRILERITEPDRVITFRVDWEDDEGRVQSNRGYRVQFNNALGPYKGGLRFHPSVTLGMLKFLAFEQTFKNCLTTLPMGGAKGGSDFDPKGKSDAEILRFCRSFITELSKYIGIDDDCPAGDIGVGGREIGYMYGQYRRMKGGSQGVLTGKGIGYGGSLLRPEATGYGSLYFAQGMLADHGDSIKGKDILVSGYGNVAWGVAKKATELGARVLTLSNEEGYILDEKGVGTPEKWQYMLDARSANNKHGVMAGYAKKFGAKFVPGKKPWEAKADMAFPCATQNEVSLADAKMMAANGVTYVVETSNMGCTEEASDYLISQKIAYAPGKAANAGGVAVSGLEMAQNAGHLYWTSAEVDAKLKGIMKNIHDVCVEDGVGKDGYIDYRKGANIASFRRVADAMVAMGY